MSTDKAFEVSSDIEIFLIHGLCIEIHLELHWWHLHVPDKISGSLLFLSTLSKNYSCLY